jgi:hypothetical protein
MARRRAGVWLARPVVGELSASLGDVCQYLTPYSLHEAEGEVAAYERAQELVERYTPAA